MTAPTLNDSTLTRRMPKQVRLDTVNLVTYNISLPLSYFKPLAFEKRGLIFSLFVV